MRHIFRIFNVLTTFALLAGVAGCDESLEFSNQAPVDIGISKDKCYISTGSVVSLTASATDPDGDDIFFAWEASSGTFSPASGEGRSVSWTAPSSGTHVLTVRVTDRIDTSSKSIEVSVGEQILVLPGSNTLSDNGSYYIYGQASQIMVEFLTTLVIEPGVTIIFDNGYSGITVRGRLEANGTPGEPITFRANYCPGGSERSWEGIRFEGSQSSGVMKHCNILDAETAIAMFDNATAALDTCNLTNNAALGLGVYQSSTISVTGCKIWDNGSGLRTKDSDTTVRYSSIRYNGQFGVHAEGEDVQNLDIEWSHISNNTEGFRLSDSARPRVKNCSIFLNEAGSQFRYGIYLYNYTGGGVLDFEYNYWGAIDSTSIADMMDLDDGNASIDFQPWLEESPVDD